MSLKNPTLLELALDQLLRESFDAMKEIMDTYFELTTKGAISKQKLINIQTHVDKLAEIMEKVNK